MLYDAMRGRKPCAQVPVASLRSCVQAVRKTMAARGLEPAPLSEQLEERAKLEHLKAKHGFSEPDRGNLDDSSIRWREGNQTTPSQT